MISFKYEHISKIMKLADEEIVKLEKRRNDMFPMSAIPTVDREMEDIKDEDKKKFEEEIDVLKEIKEGFENELKKVSFAFSIGEKEHKIAEVVNPIFGK